VFGPLSFLEVVGYPRLETFQDKMVLVVPLRININCKAQTVDEIIRKKYEMHIACFSFLMDELKYELRETAMRCEYHERFEKDISRQLFAPGYSMTDFADHVLKQVGDIFKEHKESRPEDFSDNETYRKHVVEMFNLGVYARSKFKHYLVDKNQYLKNFMDFPLNASHFLHVGYNEYRKPTQTALCESKEMFELCKLKGLSSLPCSNEGDILISAAALGLSSKDFELIIDVMYTYQSKLAGKYECRLDKKDKSGYSAISMAAMNGHADILQILLRKKADINSVANDGSTPIILAASNGQLQCVSILLHNNAAFYPAIPVAIGTNKVAEVKLLLMKASAGSHSISFSKFEEICYSSFKQILSSTLVLDFLVSKIRFNP
jgi:hypothetical protein